MNKCLTLGACLLIFLQAFSQAKEKTVSGIHPLPARIPQSEYGIVQQPNEKVKCLLDARFGMFIHWGLYAGPAKGEWYMENSAVPIEEYRKLAYGDSKLRFSQNKNREITIRFPNADDNIRIFAVRLNGKIVNNE